MSIATNGVGESRWRKWPCACRFQSFLYGQESGEDDGCDDTGAESLPGEPVIMGEKNADPPP